MNALIPKSALVLGGGFAGLLVAQALDSVGVKVTLLEQNAPKEKSGIPQLPHLHVLLAKGREICERYFPGLDEELSHLGCPEMDWGVDTYWNHPFGVFPQKATRVRTRSVSRETLHEVLTRRVRENAGITFLNCREIQKINWTVGVKSKKRIESIATSSGEAFSADLFLDCLGRHSLLFDPILADWTQTHSSYVSIGLRKIGPLRGKPQQWNVQARPNLDTLGGVLIPVENQKFILTLLIRNGTPLPRTAEEVLMRTKQLRDLQIACAVSDMEVLSKPSYYGKLGTARVHFQEQVSNCVHLGDRVAVLNPTYGQGMLSAALQVECLMRSIESGSIPTQEDFFRSVRLPYFFSRWEDQAQLGKKSASPLDRVIKGAIRLAVTYPFFHQKLMRQHHGLGLWP